MPGRLAARLIVSLTLLVILVEGAFGLVALHSQERQLLDNMILGADQLSRSITSATWHAMLLDRRDAAYEVMRTIAEKQGIDRIRIFNKEGRVTFSTAAERTTQVDKRAEACFLCHAEAQPLVRVAVPSRARVFRTADGRRKLAMVTPIYNEPACSRGDCHAHPAERNVLGVLDVSLDLDQVDADVAAIRHRMLLLLGVEIAVISVFIVIFTRRFVDRPIRQLIEGTKAVGDMELDRPLEVTTSGELGELARSFETMRKRLNAAVTDLNRLTQSLEEKVRERGEQLRVAQQKLVQSDRLASLGQLAATVAHEINNPLSGVLNLAMLMQRILKADGIPADRVDEFRRYLAQVSAETARTGRIVADLLAFSRQAKPRGERADLNELTRSTAELVAPKLEAAEVSTALDLDPALPPIKADGAQIRQVVMNLLLNAADAMPEGGRLEIRTRLHPSGNAVVLEVHDDGVGIAPEHLDRIFDPFFTTKEEGRGVGLGLTVVYGIVHAHGGEIDVESRPGHGTTFRVTLPLAGGPTEVGASQALGGTR